MKYANLTTAETRLCKGFFDWRIDSITQFTEAQIKGTGHHRQVTSEQFEKELRRIWEYYRETGITEFADAAQKFQVGWQFYRRLTHKPKPAKQVRSEWMGFRLWLSYRLTSLIHKGSGYAFISEQLESRDVYLDTDAIKMRVNAFEKRQRSRKGGDAIRELFEGFKSARDHSRHPRKMRSVRWVNHFFTSLTDRDLKFLSKMSRELQV